MKMNNVTAPEYYDNDPAENDTEDTSGLNSRLDEVERNLIRKTTDELIKTYPEARVTRFGAIILVDEQPPMIDLREVDGNFVLSGFFNEETEERALNLPEKFVNDIRNSLSQ